MTFIPGSGDHAVSSSSSSSAGSGVPQGPAPTSQQQATSSAAGAALGQGQRGQPAAPAPVEPRRVSDFLRSAAPPETLAQKREQLTRTTAQIASVQRRIQQLEIDKADKRTQLYSITNGRVATSPEIESLKGQIKGAETELAGQVRKLRDISFYLSKIGSGPDLSASDQKEMAAMLSVVAENLTTFSKASDRWLQENASASLEVAIEKSIESAELKLSILDTQKQFRKVQKQLGQELARPESDQEIEASRRAAIETMTKLKRLQLANKDVEIKIKEEERSGLKNSLSLFVVPSSLFSESPVAIPGETWYKETKTRLEVDLIHCEERLQKLKEEREKLYKEFVEYEILGFE